MRTVPIRLARYIVLMLGILVFGIQLVYTQSIEPRFLVTSITGKALKNVSVHIDSSSCGADSLAIYDKQSGYYVFSCFPALRTTVFLSASGHVAQRLDLSKGVSTKAIEIVLQEKGAQSIVIEDTEYKYWELRNVLFLKEKEGKQFRLQELTDSLYLFESEYYGENFYEHKERIDFNTLNNSYLKIIRQSGYTLIASPVILLFKERPVGTKKFKAINKLLPVTNLVEVVDQKKLDPEALQVFGLDEQLIYKSQRNVGSPVAYLSINPGLGIEVLGLRSALDNWHKDIKVQFLDVINWYGIELKATEVVEKE